MSAPNVHDWIAAGKLTCSIEDAAAVLGVSRGTAYLAARDGSLGCAHRLGRRWIVSVPELCSLLGLDFLGGVNANGDGAHPTGPTEVGSDESAPGPNA